MSGPQKLHKDVLIALAGESGAGKSTSGGLLQAQGFHLIELTKPLRREAEALLGTPSRSDVQRHARAQQAKHGNDHYARLALSGLEKATGEDIVLDGIRNPEELQFVIDFAGRTGRAFCLLALVTPPETRFSRVKGRSREGDPTEYEHFREDDKRALGDGKSGFQTNAYLIGKADRQIENRGDQAALEAALLAAVQDVRMK